MMIMSILWRRRRLIMQQVTIIMMCRLLLAVNAQDLSGPVTSTVSFLDAGLIAIGHLAAFVTCLLRGRLDVEMPLRDALDLCWTLHTDPPVEDTWLDDATLVMRRTSPNPNAASVILLTKDISNPVMFSFMKYAAARHEVNCIAVRAVRLVHVATTAASGCLCGTEAVCKCIVFGASAEVTKALVRRMPGVIKQLFPIQIPSISDDCFMYLLASQQCLIKGCHGCSREMLRLGSQGELLVGEPEVQSPAVACMWTSNVSDRCLCIPLNLPDYDDWSNLLLRMMRTKDEAGRNVKIGAAFTLELYLKGQRPTIGVVYLEMSKASFLTPRLLEALINIILTGWFRVDGFSSALTARRVVRDFVVDTGGNGLHAHGFLSRIGVDVSPGYSHACQVFTFRSKRLYIRPVVWIGAAINASCTIWWMVAVALGHGLGNWSTSYSVQPTMGRLIAILGAILGSVNMDLLHVYYNRSSWKHTLKHCRVLILVTLLIEILGFVLLTTIAGVYGLKPFSTWIYCVLLSLAWMKWLAGATSLDSSIVCEMDGWRESGILVYSSAYLITAILAGVGGKWE